MDFRGMLFVLVGVFTLAGSLGDWDWFMNHHKAQFFNRIWGRQGTRIFYGIIGMVITLAGLAATLGVVDMGR